MPIEWYPLSTYTTDAVIPLACGLDRNAAVAPTSDGLSGSVSGEFADAYSTIRSMMPIALAARDAKGPAEMQFTRAPKRRPASYASTRVSLSSAALADDMPPPYPGITRSLAMYVSDRNDPLGRSSGPNRWTNDTIEYALTPNAVR